MTIQVTGLRKRFAAGATIVLNRLDEQAPRVRELLARLGGMEDVLVSSVHLNTEQSRVTIFDLPDLPGNCSRVFSAVATGGVLVDMIVQNLTAQGRAELSFTVPAADLTRALGRVPESEALMRRALAIAAATDEAPEVLSRRYLELGTGLRLSQVVAQECSGLRVAALSGPSFALEVGRGLPTAVTAAPYVSGRDITVDGQTFRISGAPANGATPLPPRRPGTPPARETAAGWPGESSAGRGPTPCR